MPSKPAIASRSLRQAFGPYTRLEFHKPTSRWRIASRALVKGSAYFVAAVLSGAAFGFFLAFVERL